MPYYIGEWIYIFGHYFVNVKYPPILSWPKQIICEEIWLTPPKQLGLEQYHSLFFLLEINTTHFKESLISLNQESNNDYAILICISEDIDNSFNRFPDYHNIDQSSNNRQA